MSKVIASMQAQARVLSVAELLDAIIGYLNDIYNYEPLQNCTLVCKSWSSVASRHLFRTFSIDPLEYGTAENGSRSPIPRCLELDSHPRICSNVHTLVLAVSKKLVRRWEFKQNHHSSFPVRLLQYLIEVCPLLDALQIKWMAPFAFTPDLPIPTFPPRSYKLKEFSISARPQVFDDMFIEHVLPLFAQLDVFDFRISLAPNRYGPAHEVLDVGRVSHRVPVTSLGSNWQMTDGIPYALAEAVDVSNLRCLRMHEYRPTEGSADCINAIISHAQFLETFEVHTQFMSVEVDIDEDYQDIRRGLAFRLENCHRLRSFSFTINLDVTVTDSDGHDHPLYSYLWEPSLASLYTVSPSLSTFVLILWIPADRVREVSAPPLPLLRTLDWTILDRVLESRPNIAQVNVQLIPASSLQLLDEAQFKQGLPDRVAKAIKLSAAE